MKKTIKLAVVAALALGATSAFATNGSTMIGMGAKTRAMAGIGIGMGHGAESILSNPAHIAYMTKNTEISFGGTLFMPDVENTNTLDTTAFGGGLGVPATNTSAADTFVIPSVSIAHKVNDNFYTGIGMWGTGGLGVDYRDATAPTDTQFQMVTSLQLMQFGVPLVYKMNNLSLGITPLIQYGTLDINYDFFGTGVGGGIGSDLSLGYNLGLAYNTGALTIGAVYKSEIEMDYDGQLPGALNTMIAALTGGLGQAYTNNTLSTPAEYGVGVSYSRGGHTLALDYKNINWEDAAGYKDFGWEDQDIFVVGYEYATDAWAVRAGYSDTDSAVQNNTGKGIDPAFGLTDTMNILGFPGNIETHYAIGGSYNISEVVSMDLAYAYAPEVTNSAINFTGQPISVTHSETSYSFQLNLAY